MAHSFSPFALSLAMFYTLLAVVSLTRAASADQWRTRSIYQIVTDRFAHPDLHPGDSCDPGKQTWCGGTWKAIESKLDYIKNAGFTASECFSLLLSQYSHYAYSMD
jgi:alpha-amylase